MSGEHVIVEQSAPTVRVELSPERARVVQATRVARIRVETIAGTPGPPGPADRMTFTRPAASNLSALRVVVPDGTGQVELADPTDPDHLHRPMWLTVTSALAGNPVDLVSAGEITDAGWAWPFDAAIFAGLGGLPVIVPPAAAFTRQIAQATSPTSLFVGNYHPIVLD